MTLSITDANPFNVTAVHNTVDEQRSEQPPGEADGETPAPQAAPPLTGGGPLLSLQDSRLLFDRQVRGDEKTTYLDILQTFQADPAHRNDPQAFLSSLSPSEIEILKKAQSLPTGDSVDVSAMNKEEALNLILPFSQQVDLDGDGFVGGGNGGKSFHFPGPNAPQALKDAWNDATQGLSMGDRLQMEFYFMMELTSANMQVDANGKLNQTQPGEPGWRNVFTEPGYSYREAVSRFLDNNDFNFQHGGVSFEQHQRNAAMLTKLDDALAAHAIA